MKYLIVGNGNAREHCTYLHFIETLHSNDSVGFALLKDNGLLAGLPNVHRVKDNSEAIELSLRLKIDLVVLLSPDLLLKGVYDEFVNHGLTVFGVPYDTTKLESSKVFSKKFMYKYNIPTPKAYFFDSASDSLDFIRENWVNKKNEYVIKIDEFSDYAHERVIMPKSIKDAEKNIFQVFSKKNKKRTILIEEKLEGIELSLHVIFDGKNYKIFPGAMDYKKLKDKNKGPNTHGMGSIASSRFIEDEIIKNIELSILKPTFEGIKKEGLEYKYILYIGLINVKNNWYVLEYNVRSGNPEWASILSLVDNSLSNLFLATIKQKLDSFDIIVNNKDYAGTIFATSFGYPNHLDNSLKLIEGVRKKFSNVEILGENIFEKDGQFYAGSGRIFALCTKAKTLNIVRNRLYSAMKHINFKGKYHRNDIALDD